VGHKVVNVTDALQLVHDGLVSASQQDKDDAESLLSALILHLRHKQAILPGDLAQPVRRLAARHGRGV
jgi:hypothetical protein